MSKKPYIVGICGGSASGKTFLLNQLMSQLPGEKLSLLSQDNYYKKLEDQMKDEEGLVNFDHPDSINLEQLMLDVQKLTKGQSFELQEYTFNNPNKVPKVFTYSPTPILILEGLFIYHKPALSQLIDLKLFIEADEHIKLSRRLKRDHAERGYSIESILRDYEKFVAPMYHRYVAPTRTNCDMIIPNNKHMYKAIQVLVNHLRTIIVPD
ncbi:MAG: uridine kinase [Bacteroidetes bacterium]|nr:uridine kinase [Bacteroidota bacterium]MCB0842785.1 uridine kinase [Bacteroidota bacterium]